MFGIRPLARQQDRTAPLPPDADALQRTSHDEQHATPRTENLATALDDPGERLRAPHVQLRSIAPQREERPGKGATPSKAATGRERGGDWRLDGGWARS